MQISGGGVGDQGRCSAGACKAVGARPAKDRKSGINRTPDSELIELIGDPCRGQSAAFMDLSDCIEGKGEKAREIVMTFPSKQLLNRPALEDGPGNLGRQQVRSGAELIRVK